LKHTYNGTAMDRNFFCVAGSFQFRICIWSGGPRDCKRFPLKRGFPYVRVTLQTGFTVPQIKPVNGPFLQTTVAVRL